MPPLITVVIPSFNPPRGHLIALHDSLCAQTLTDFEALIVDDGSTAADYAPLRDPRFRVLRQDHNRGPATCRNLGAQAASAPILFFTDTDCTLHPETLAACLHALALDPIVVGDTITDVRTPFGRAVALLGFPGGGNIGFDRVWRVSPDGHSTSFSSCNVAFRRETFEQLGGFNEAFPVPGGEDTVLARQALEAGLSMRYEPRQVVYHVERTGLRSFLRWQIVRGRGNYYIKQHVRGVGGYLKLRLWTFSNSLRAAGFKYFLPVLSLIVLSVLFQTLGFQIEKRNAGRN